MQNQKQSASLFENRNSLFNEESGFDGHQEFRLLASEYVRYGKLAGVEMTPFHDSELPFFSKLMPDQRRQVLESLRHSTSICEMVQQEGYTIKDSRALIWSAFKRFGLRPPSDFFTYFTSDDDIVEMHSAEGRQMFRTFNFYCLCSYTLEELFCQHWAILYGRCNEAVNSEIAELMRKIFSGEVRSTFPAGVRPHTVFETASESKLTIFLDIRNAAPLFIEGTSIAGASIVVEKAHKIVEPQIRPQLDITF
jgi:hypothetical protein